MESFLDPMASFHNEAVKAGAVVARSSIPETLAAVVTPYDIATKALREQIAAQAKESETVVELFKGIQLHAEDDLYFETFAKKLVTGYAKIDKEKAVSLLRAELLEQLPKLKEWWDTAKVYYKDSLEFDKYLTLYKDEKQNHYLNWVYCDCSRKLLFHFDIMEGDLVIQKNYEVFRSFDWKFFLSNLFTSVVLPKLTTTKDK